MIRSRIDTNLKQRNIGDLIDQPKSVHVRNFDDDAVRSFFDDFDAAESTGQSVVPIYIDSYGGNVYSLFAMVDRINASDVPVATIVIGKAMSCGAVLFSCGTAGLRFVAPTATIMIHDVSNMIMGGFIEMENQIDETQRLRAVLLGLLDTNCKKRKGYFDSMLAKVNYTDWFLDAKGAVKQGIASKIGLPDFHLSVNVEHTFGVR